MGPQNDENQTILIQALEKLLPSTTSYVSKANELCVFIDSGQK